MKSKRKSMESDEEEGEEESDSSLPIQEPSLQDDSKD
jgi:hypothetical protein